MPAVAQDDILTSIMTRLHLRTEKTGIASSNGRLEAQSVNVAPKYGGRIAEVGVSEGAIVEAGEVIARMDDRDVQAKMLVAQAAVLQAQASKQQAEAAVMQSQSALAVAQITYDRTVALNASGHASQSVLDDITNALHAAEAGLAAAKAQISNADALIAAADANVEEIRIALDDLILRAPLRGRVQYRLHESGEVIAAGTPVVTLLDLTDVYMNLYLPADVVGTLGANDEARLVLDPITQYVIPARVTFIAPQAQFTPKSVETADERSQLVFRVKLSIPRELLMKFEQYVKVGVRGVGYVRTDQTVDWPANLQVKLPQ